MADPNPNSSASAQQIVTQLRGLWARMPRLARLGAVVAIAVVVGAVAWTSLAPGGEPWVAVSTSMPAEDAAELSAVLSGRGIPHRTAAGGQRVEVPAERLTEARVAASAAGLPRGGKGMEIFDDVKLGMSSKAEDVNYLRALQGELARSIATLAPIEGARVHIALGRRAVIRDTEVPASASVALRVRPGVRLTPEQVRGVKQLVASSVVGLAADRVAVLDQNGDVLAADDAAARSGADAAELEAAIGHRVRTLLEKVVGPGHVAVVVSVEMDRRRVTLAEEIFDPARTAIRSTTRTGVTAPAAAITGGIAGVQGNLPGAPAAAGGASAGAGRAADETINYEVTRTVRQTDQPEDKIGRIHLAILVDHRADAAGALASLPAAELAQLAQLARQAAGLDDGRGDALEVSSFAFAPEEVIAPRLPEIAPRGLPIPIPLPLAGGAGAGLLAIIIVVMVVRGRRRRRPTAMPVLALPASLSEFERALADPSGRSALPALAAANQRSLEERVLGAVRSDVPRTARVLAGWLAQPDPRPSKS